MYGFRTILTYNAQTKQYKLSYERPSVANDDKEITALSLADLRSKMTASRDFTPEGVRLVVDENAPLIPLIVYAEWKRRGVAGGTDAVALLKEAIGNFYINPTKNNYDVLAGISARYFSMRGDAFTDNASSAYSAVLYSLSLEILQHVGNAVLANPEALARTPNDPRYVVFSTPYRGAQR